MSENLVIIYSCDDNYARHTGVSILSVLDNNKHFKGIDIYIIENNISEENKIKINEIIKKYNRNIKYVDFSQYKSKLNLKMEWEISISSYARLFIECILPKTIDKVLYFDCDTIVAGPLDELWEVEFQENEFVAGVLDTVSEKIITKIGIGKKDRYINAGMLLINLKEWRENEIQKQFMDFIDKYNGKVTHHDQGVINGVLHQNCKVISPKFNLMTVFCMMKYEDILKYYEVKYDFYTKEEIEQAVKEPLYIHFTPGFTTRPWIKGCKHPYKEIYLKYLQCTPWKDYKLEKDNSKLTVKFINTLYRNFPLKIVDPVVKSIIGVKN